VIGGEGPQSLSAISERARIPLSTVQREVDRLERAGLRVSERIGNTRLVRPNNDSPYFSDLHSLLLKAFGPTKLLTSLLVEIPRIDRAYVYGSWARRYLGNDSVIPRDLDVVVIGSPAPNAVFAAARRAEADLNLEVNPVIVTPDDWDNPSGLIRRIKNGPLVELIGDDAT